MAGQLGDELQPTGPANPADIADPAARARQEADNRAFGEAIQEWNLHNYEVAQELFLDHLLAYPDSPWAAESELHLGCALQYLGRLDEAEHWFVASKSRAPLGHPMHQRALLRLGVVAMDRGDLDKAAGLFTQLRQNDSDPGRMTYASYWIRALSLMKAEETALRDCGQKSLAEICAVMGMEDEAQALRELGAAGPHGFTMQELEAVALEHGLNARTVLGSPDTLERMPLPMVAHYSDKHFVAVLGRDAAGRLRVHDTRVGHAVAMDADSFARQWSGLATIFSDAEVPGVRLASVEETVEAMGGCCGEPRYPDDLGDDCPDKNCGMPGWNINRVNMNLMVTDTPMWWEAPYGPDVHFTLTYNSMDSLIDVRPFGDKWTFAYASYLMVDPSGGVLVVRGDARGEDYHPDGNGGYIPHARNSDKTLRKIAGHDYRFELEDAEGTVYLYDVPASMGGSSAASLLVSVTDTYGTALTITHNSEGAVTAVSHPAAATTLVPSGTWSFVYGANGKVASIDDPFGRQATFTYDSEDRLVGQTDMGGVAYGYGYTVVAEVSDIHPTIPNQLVTRTDELFLNAIHTPNGTTQFYTEPSDGITISPDTYPAPGDPMWQTYRITVTDPLGAKEEYFYAAWNRGWHRDKNHYEEGVPTYGSLSASLSDPHEKLFYTLAGGRGVISQSNRQGGGTVHLSSYTSGGNPGSIQTPDGRIVYYTYNNRGRVLTYKDDNGTGTTADDVLLTFTYAANGLDLIELTRSVGSGSAVVLGQWEYHSTTRGLSAAIDRAGIRTEYTRNVQGQVTAVEHPRGDVTMHYDAKGWLQEIRLQPVGGGAVVTLRTAAVDEVGRVVADSDEDGYTLLYEYDELNRLVKTTYPDGTFILNGYSCCNLTSITARDGQVTAYAYDGMRRLIQESSPGGRTLHYGYDPVGNLVELVAGRGETVEWEYDSTHRMTKRINQDGTALTYGYHASNGRLLWSKDAQNRQTSYAYAGAGLIQSITHPDLPTQSYTYNPLGQRLTWSDGSQVTSYVYDALDRLESIDGPLVNDTIAYTYDQWQRLESWSYDGASESYTYDDLDRIATVTNPLGSFTHAYVGNGRRLASLAYPISGLESAYSYHPAAGDLRLAGIDYEGPGTTSIAEFAYTYTPDGEIATWSRSQPGMSGGTLWKMGYDPDRQLMAVLETPLGGSAPNPHRLWTQRYDASGNRTSHQRPGRTESATFNPRNQLTSLTGGGSTVFRGQVNEPAQVTLDGKAARVYANGTFEAGVDLGPGTHQVTLEATDRAANTTTEVWEVDNGSGTRSLTYDTDGNTLDDGMRTYAWDARNRLTGIARGEDAWAFAYNGANLRTGESKNGQLQREWVWHGTEVVEERLADGSKRRYWSYGIEELDDQGAQAGKRYLLRDHLGSTRVVLDGAGVTVASYDYDPWGVRRKLSGSGEETVGYTGHWEHESGLVMAPFRVYDPGLGRWLSEDPIREAGGVKLYGYVENRPTILIDSDGLEPNTPYLTKREALERAADSVHRRAGETGREAGAVICRYPGDRWGYGDIQDGEDPENLPEGTQGRVNIDPTVHPRGTIFEGTIHSHNVPGGSDEWSPNDQRHADALKKRCYMVTPGGRIRGYHPPSARPPIRVRRPSDRFFDGDRLWEMENRHPRS